MEFRTTFSGPNISAKLTYESEVLSLGSCFANMLGERLSKGKFKVLANPFGIIYNPLSLLKLLSGCLLGQPLDLKGVLNHESRFFHYQLHSSFSADSSEVLQQQFLEQSKQVAEQLIRCSHIFFTWGTSHVYALKDTGSVVANCHKQPAALFARHLLGLDEMEAAFREFQGLLLQINPNVRMVVTVSPVRHIKDGIPENQLSKSILRVFSHQLQTSYRFVDYFPSYEWMMDDLRDYRFYKNDMIHPSEVAEEYIWSQFLDSFMDPSVRSRYEKVRKLQRAMAHKPFFPEGEAHQRFLDKLRVQMEEMQPQLDFSSEIAVIQAMKLG
ncbi:GSCFA domain-containing protein [Lunatimonas salinarum]|uniref:GSCFA domain-containing protein n=1 Tax=Lunatimonas salinarum TaxID=1774590 RepID=UPI001ADFDB98|nr:GSCFA domain-containing protein [Lunatimonas salinarum]